MFAHRVAAVVPLILAAACGGDTAAGPAKQSDAPAASDPRRERCTAFADESARVGRMTGVALQVAFADPSASRSDHARTQQAFAATSDALAREFLDKCMQWPDAVIDCLGMFGALKPGCQETLAEALGVAEAKLPADVPPGPAPAWSLKLAAKPAAVAVAKDGTVLAVVDRTLIGVRDGAIAWQTLDQLRGWVFVTAGLGVVARRDRVIAVDPSDGREVWSVALPPVPGADEYDEPLVAVIAAEADDGLWLGDTVARFFRLHPRSCARSTAKRAARGCLVAAGALVDETLDEDADLLVDADGRLVLHEYGFVRMFDASWTTTLTARAHDHLGAFAPSPSGLALVIDDDVVLLDPDKCDGEEFAPSGWPQPGQLYFRDGDECRDCAGPPPGCRRWRRFVEGVTGAPAVGDDGTVIVHADGFTRALRAGEELWKTPTAGGGSLLRIDDRVIGISTGLADDDPMALFELAIEDGTYRWRTPLPVSLPDSLYASSDLVLAHGHGWLVAGYLESIVALRRPSAP